MPDEDYSTAGDAALAAGMPILDPTTHRVKFGADEINVTRDLLATQISEVSAEIATERARITRYNPSGRVFTAGTGAPSNSNGANGDVYFGVI